MLMRLNATDSETINKTREKIMSEYLKIERTGVARGIAEVDEEQRENRHPEGTHAEIDPMIRRELRGGERA